MRIGRVEQTEGKRQMGKTTPPPGHGDLLIDPPFEQWAALVERNRQSAARRGFTVAGVCAQEYQRQARAEALAVSAGCSERLGIPIRPLGDPDGPIIATGHQPELYHPGVWIKDFLLQRFSDEQSASAIDVVVDTDGFEAVGLTAPCLRSEGDPCGQDRASDASRRGQDHASDAGRRAQDRALSVSRCRQDLARASAGCCYAAAPAPTAAEVQAFAQSGKEMLETLPVAAPGRCFARFCAALAPASEVAENLGEAVTIARRRFESSAKTDYAALPVSHLVKTRSFAAYVADIVLSATRFAQAYNSALGGYRRTEKVRTPAQPFPDLALSGNRAELPFWLIGNGSRETLSAEPDPASAEVRLVCGARTVATLPADPLLATGAVHALKGAVAPKALALMLFMRLFASDLFIHGTGGARYDRVTDDVCRRYYGVEPPGFVCASLTLHLPSGMRTVSGDEVAAARAKLNRLKHNPDQALGEGALAEGGAPKGASLADEHQRKNAQALALCAEKTELVAAIARPGADKKELGTRIRAVNIALAAIVEPYRLELENELRVLEEGHRATEVLLDRTYPFCLWDPLEVREVSLLVPSGR